MKSNPRILLAACLALAAMGCGKSKDKAAQVQKVEVSLGEIRQVVQASGNVQPMNKVAILPPISGRIDKIVAYEGAYVKRGQILAWMSSSDRAALLDAARSQGPDEIKHWEDAYKATPIIAPADGMIIARNIVAGQTVAGETDTYDLSDRLIVLASVDETDLGKVHSGQMAEVTVDAYPSKPFRAQVALIGHQAVKVNNVVSYMVNLEPQKVPGELRAGMTANVNFIILEKKDVLCIPSFAVKGQSGGPAEVKVMGADKKAPEARSIVLGITDGAKVEVVSGLEEGDKIVVSSLDLPKALSGGMGSSPAGAGGQRQGGGGGRRQ